MKAGVLKGIEDLSITEVDKPEPREGEVLIEVKACAICGTDIKVYHYGHKLIRFPRITGHEVSGIIVEKGKKIENWKVGERVMISPVIPCGSCFYCQRGWQSMCNDLTAIGYQYDGGFAQFMIVPEKGVRNGCVHKIPEGLSFEEAALAEPLACVINGQELSKIRLGDIVLIIGSGPIGCLHTELARLNGASLVILADLEEERLKLAQFTGADFFINCSVEDIKERVGEITEGHMADRVIVAAGSGKAQEDSLPLVAKMGSINFFGGLPKKSPNITFNSNLLHYGEFFVVGTHGSTPYHNEIALSLISSGKIKIKKYISRRFPLKNLLEGLKLAEERKSLKIIILPWE